MNIIQRFKYGTMVGPYSARSLYGLYQALKIKDIYSLDHFKGWTKDEIRLYYVHFLVPIMKKHQEHNLASVGPHLKRMKGRALAIGTIQIMLGYALGYMLGICLVVYLIVKYVIGPNI